MEVSMADRNGAAGPPVRSPHYSDREKKQDYKRGRKDARRHLPLVPRQHARRAIDAHLAVPGADAGEKGQAATPVSLTPFLYELFHRRNQDLAELYELYLNERGRLLETLREADGQRQKLLIQQAAAQDQVEKLAQPLTEEEATAFTYGERKAGHPEELVRRRRTRAREEKFHAAQRELSGINDRLTDMTTAAGKAQGALSTRLQATQAAGMKVLAHYEQRRASYLNGLTHAHRRNVELLELLKLTDPGVPDWVTWGPVALGGA
jgi:hypothetical protein